MAIPAVEIWAWNTSIKAMIQCSQHQQVNASNAPHAFVLRLVCRLTLVHWILLHLRRCFRPAVSAWWGPCWKSETIRLWEWMNPSLFAYKQRLTKLIYIMELSHKVPKGVGGTYSSTFMNNNSHTGNKCGCCTILTSIVAIANFCQEKCAPAWCHSSYSYLTIS